MDFSEKYCGFCVIAVTANIIITLFLAKIISIIPSKGLKTLFRTILFIPCIAPMVGTSMVWKYGIVGTDGGLLNRIMSIFGMAPRNWYLTTWQMLAIIIVYTLWADIGYNVVLFTAGIEAVPKVFDEAAELDGAGPIRRFIMIKSAYGKDVCICGNYDNGELFPDVCAI